ncbi:MAG: FHA domain-containing protein [Planctomycetes bacterium]|nr:FHA domain-containing protein [Planctomycetota bacterium]
MTSSFLAKNFGQYIVSVGELSCEKFAESHPVPTLVVEPFVHEEEAQLATMQGVQGQGELPIVLPVRGRRSTAHGYGGDRITLGRTGNNDLVIPSSDISKIHGFFSESESGMSYTDAHSSYGSKVDGQEARPGVPILLKSGAKLELASIKAHYFLPPELYAYLTELMKG